MATPPSNQAAAFAAAFSRTPSPNADNVPGFDFMNRVMRSFLIALGGHTEAMNAAWSEAKQGTFGFGSAMKAFTNVAEGYFDVVLESWNGPGYIPRPVWVYFDYIQNEDGTWTPETLKAPAKMDRAVTPETQADATVFVPLGGGSPQPGLYRDGGIAIQDRELVVTLDPTAVRSLPTGQYVSFIFAKGRSAEAPLAIVVLRVTQSGTSPSRRSRGTAPSPAPAPRSRGKGGSSGGSASRAPRTRKTGKVEGA